MKAIKRYVRKVFCIFPFEVAFYRDRHDYAVDYVGNPSKEEVELKLKSIVSREEFLKRHNLPDRPIIAIVPGSRRSEIKNNLMIMETAAARFPDYQPVIAAAPGIDLKPAAAHALTRDHGRAGAPAAHPLVALPAVGLALRHM